jgi:hypothetical protein
MRMNPPAVLLGVPVWYNCIGSVVMAVYGIGSA